LIEATHAASRIERLLARGAPWEAIDAFHEALTATASDDASLFYWGALAHARAGDPREAHVLLDRARDASPPVELLHEILCLEGRLAKDEASVSKNALDAAKLNRSRDAYLAAYTLCRDPYPGVNAATLSLLLDDRATARILAAEVLATLQAGPLDAWRTASSGEAHLVLGDVDEAIARYAEAVLLHRGHAGSIASMRKQLALLARVLPDAAHVLSTLPAASVLAFSGHMIDVAGREAPRFPPELEPAVAAAIRGKLVDTHDPVVFTSAACGADLLFVEAALDIGAEVNVVLPFARDEFIEVSVAVGGAKWVERFERAMARVARVIPVTTESYLGDDVLFEHALQLVEGLAFTRARQLETEATLLCVLDSASTAKVGGTRAAFDRWVEAGGTPDVIDLAALRASSTITPRQLRTAPEAMTAQAERPHRTIKTLLFADIAGFGRLHDAHAPLFHARFLELVAAEIAACRVAPLESNTWGDALYVVFAAPEDGAAFALGLRDRMKHVDWVAAGLDESTDIRIALHAGAVFCGFDPVIGRDNYFGTSVTTAARIEPVAPPGLVYASEAFVATLAARRVTRFTFDYVGVLQLPKKFGEARLYAIDRPGD